MQIFITNTLPKNLSAHFQCQLYQHPVGHSNGISTTIFSGPTKSITKLAEQNFNDLGISKREEKKWWKKHIDSHDLIIAASFLHRDQSTIHLLTRPAALFHDKG